MNMRKRIRITIRYRSYVPSKKFQNILSFVEVISLEEKHNVAIVGCGIIAQTHLHALKKLKSLKVVAVCDTDKEKAIATSKEWKIDHYYTDFSKMLSDENISILSILTPPSSHAFLAIEAIKRGINVVVEKPLTMTTKEADSIINALRCSSAKMTVVYHFLFSKAMLESLSLIRRQEIGEVLSVDMKMVQGASKDPMASDPNHWSHKLLGGRFGEMLPHPVYVVQSILGDKLHTKKVLVSKRGNIPWMHNDELHAILENEKGIGSLHVSLNAPRVSYTCDVYGTRKILRIDLTRQMVLQLGSMDGSNFSVFKDSLSEACRLSLLTMKNALQYSFRKRSAGVSRFYNMFLDNIRNNNAPLVTPEMAYNTVKIVEEICTDIAETKKEARAL
jgi:predicted dehydrogenase